MASATDPAPRVGLADRIEELSPLDAVAGPVGAVVRGAIGPGELKDALTGRWLGPALHPLLTDVVIGCWVSANILDVVGGRASQPAADRLLALGILAYPPTAVTGALDWADTEAARPGVRRVGLVH